MRQACLRSLLGRLAGECAHLIERVARRCARNDRLGARPSRLPRVVSSTHRAVSSPDQGERSPVTNDQVVAHLRTVVSGAANGALTHSDRSSLRSGRSSPRRERLPALRGRIVCPSIPADPRVARDDINRRNARVYGRPKSALQTIKSAVLPDKSSLRAAKSSRQITNSATQRERSSQLRERFGGTVGRPVND